MGLKDFCQKRTSEVNCAQDLEGLANGQSWRKLQTAGSSWASPMKTEKCLSLNCAAPEMRADSRLQMRTPREIWTQGDCNRSQSCRESSLESGASEFQTCQVHPSDENNPIKPTPDDRLWAKRDLAKALGSLFLSKLSLPTTTFHHLHPHLQDLVIKAKFDLSLIGVKIKINGLVWNLDYSKPSISHTHTNQHYETVSGKEKKRSIREIKRWKLKRMESYRVLSSADLKRGDKNNTATSRRTSSSISYTYSSSGLPVFKQGGFQSLS